MMPGIHTAARGAALLLALGCLAACASGARSTPTATSAARTTGSAVAAGASAASTHGEAARPGPAVRLADGRVPLDSGSLALRCGRVIDGLADVPLRDAVIVIRAGRIAAVGADLTPPLDLPLLSLPDHTCLPGLIDLHTHLTDVPESMEDYHVYLTRTRDAHLALARDNARVTLAAGVTTVRDVGTYVAWLDRDLHDAIERGDTPGPRMQFAGFYLTIPGGGGDMNIPGVPPADVPAWLRAGVARGPEAFRARAQAAVAGGATVLKVIASGAVLAFGGVPAAPEMTQDEIAAVVEVAHAAGIKVAAHAHGARSVIEAITAGVDTIEHASLIDEAGLALARERKVALVMDVYDGDYIDGEGRARGWPEEFLRKNVETTEIQRRNFTRAHELGVTLAFGTDAAVYPHGLQARQFPIMVQRGMAPMEAIRAATSVAARVAGWDDRVGALAPGRYGDVIAVRGDPLADITRLSAVDVVVKGGLAWRLPGATAAAGATPGTATTPGTGATTGTNAVQSTAK